MSQEPHRPGTVLIVCHPARSPAVDALLDHLGFHWWAVEPDDGMPLWAAVLWFGHVPQTWRLPSPIPHQRSPRADS